MSIMGCTAIRHTPVVFSMLLSLLTSAGAAAAGGQTVGFAQTTATVNAAGAEAVEKDFAHPDQATYYVSMELPEFSMFNNSLITGLSRRGGGAEFNLQVIKMPQMEQACWVISAQNPAVMQACSQWVALESLDVVSSTNFAQLDGSITPTLDALGALGRKLKTAVEHPGWPVHRVVGRFSANGGKPMVTLENGQSIALAGVPTGTTSPLEQMQVRAAGSVREAVQLTVSAFAPVSTDTLEVFTMSQCPFGQQVVPALARFIKEQKASGNEAPKLNVRYIFYKVSDDPESDYFTLHGAAELKENLVQMFIRDTFSDKFLPYLLARFTNPTTEWQLLAQQVGLSDTDVQMLQLLIQSNAKMAIAQEYRYVHDLAGVEDKSPTYMWNGRLIDSPQQADTFASFQSDNLPMGACSQ